MTVRVRRAAVDVDGRQVEPRRRDDLEVVAVGQPARARRRSRSSTSRIRLTSSMRARLRSVVRPLLSRLAHSRATAAFLLVLTSIEPDSLRPPTMRRCWGPLWPSETNSVSRFVADPGEHLEAEVLLALLDAGDGALAGAEQVGELALGQPLVAPRVADQGADPGQVVGTHGQRL